MRGSNLFLEKAAWPISGDGVSGFAAVATVAGMPSCARASEYRNIKQALKICLIRYFGFEGSTP
jgi:hypothetical protein